MSSPRLNLHRGLVFILSVAPMCLMGWLTGLALAGNWELSTAYSGLFSWGVGIAVVVALLALLICLGAHLANAQTVTDVWAAPRRALRDMFRFLSLVVF